MKIAIAADHAGYNYKEILKIFLNKKEIKFEDFGTYSRDSCDYPDFVHPCCNSIEEGKNNLGILICGSANGVSITANKHKKIRSAICWEVELAKLARKHNDANVISIPARFITKEKFLKIIEIFLNTDFEAGRHQKRVNKINL